MRTNAVGVHSFNKIDAFETGEYIVKATNPTGYPCDFSDTDDFKNEEGDVGADQDTKFDRLRCWQRDSRDNSTYGWIELLWQPCRWRQ